MSGDFSNHVLEANPLLSLTISTHLLVEARLRQVLHQRLQRPEALLTDQGPSFSTLVAVCEAVGAVEPDLARVLRALNSLRNKYAHRLAFEASKEQVEAFLQALRDMRKPFFISDMPASEYELGVAFASFSGWFERQYEPVSA